MSGSSCSINVRTAALGGSLVARLGDAFAAQLYDDSGRCVVFASKVSGNSRMSTPSKIASAAARRTFIDIISSTLRERQLLLPRQGASR